MLIIIMKWGKKCANFNFLALFLSGGYNPYHSYNPPSPAVMDTAQPWLDSDLWERGGANEMTKRHCHMYFAQVQNKLVSFTEFTKTRVIRLCMWSLTFFFVSKLTLCTSHLYKLMYMYEWHCVCILCGVVCPLCLSSQTYILVRTTTFLCNVL